MTGPDLINVGYLPLIRTPQGRPVAILPPLPLEREACDVAQALARSGLGRYEGAVIAIARSWIESIDTDPSIDRPQLD